MKFCMQCGHELGASRTCAGCGTTAPVEPLPAPQLPPAGARYPLFADEVDSVSVTTSGRVLTAPVSEPVLPPPPAPPVAPAEATAVVLPAVGVVPGGRRVGVLWVALAGLVLGMLVLGGWLLLRGGPSSDEPRARTGSSGAPATSGDSGLPPATASAPATRAPGVDTAGHRTSYAAFNMLDGEPTPAWERPGDGTGQVLTFTFDGPAHRTRVGLINGYAKTGEENGRTVDWYAGNRRVLQVEWIFDDGHTVSQDLRETRKVQTVDVDVTTSTVRLRLVTVSKPGKGRAARDMTPVSEVVFGG